MVDQGAPLFEESGDAALAFVGFKAKSTRLRLIET